MKKSRPLSISKRIEVTQQTDAEWQYIISALSHEIRNPLTPLKLKLQMLKRARETNREFFESHFDTVIDELLEQVDMINSVAQRFSTRSLVLERIEVVALIRAVVSLYSSYDEVQIQLTGLTECYVCADRAIVWRVMVNVLKNGIEATGGKGVIVVDVTTADDSLLITVEDNGGKISDEKLSRAFDRGFSTKGACRGMGLTLCRESLVLFGGEITLTAARNGARATIILKGTSKN